MIETESDNISIELKKRGRKKKEIETTLDETDETPKKRGRKARGVKFIVKSENTIPPVVSLQSNIILHLKCCMADLNEYMNEWNKTVSDPLIYNPIIPPDITSYNYGDTETFTLYEDGGQPQPPPSVEEQPPPPPSSCQCVHVKDLNQKIKNLKIALHKNNISSDKVSACFWCTYDFDNPPCFIPKHEINSMVYGYGSFCRPECAVAYLFKENIDDSTKFERYHLLNNIYSKVYECSNNIKPAPDPHYLLERFYGQLTIQEYRKLLKTQHSLLIVDKPMSRVLPELHEDSEGLCSTGAGKTGMYKVKRESEKEEGPSKTSIIRNKFGLTN
jgi:hypothetical protein